MRSTIHSITLFCHSYALSLSLLLCSADDHSEWTSSVQTHHGRMHASLLQPNEASVHRFIVCGPPGMAPFCFSLARARGVREGALVELEA